MQLSAGAACLLMGLWLFTRIAVAVINHRWPILGDIILIDGERIHVLDVCAPYDAPCLVLLHGASGNLREPVEALKEALGSRFRIVSIDRPGHGHSSRGPRAMSDPALQADLVAKVLRKLRIGRSIVLGHSWGASVAAALAQRHPELVSGLVLVAPATHPWPGGVSARARFFAVPYIGYVLAQFAVVPIGLAIVGSAIREVFAPDAAPADYARRIGALLAVRPKTFVANCRDVTDLNRHLRRLSRRYPDISAPTEIVTGDRDAVVAPSIHAAGLARDIAGSQLTVLAGAGHMPHWSHTAEIVVAIDRVWTASRGADSVILRNTGKTTSAATPDAA